MGEHFLKFKKKAFAVRLIKSILLGGAVGMLLSGIFLPLFKFEVIKANPILSLPIGVGGALLAGGIGYLLLQNSDKALAKRLDEEFSLDEKVQTMLAFEHSKGTIFNLQRKDANDSLSKVAVKSFKFKRLWIYILCFIIGATSLTTGFLLNPVEEAKEPIPKEEFSLTDIQKVAMQELIVYVNNSQMQSPYKESVASSLTDLLAQLEKATLKSQKDDALKTAIDEIYRQTDESSTAVELMNALWSTQLQNAQRLAEALNYYEWPKDAWNTYVEKIAEFRTSFVHTDATAENPDEEKMATETGELLAKIESNVNVSLSRAGVSTEDGLFIQLTRFATADETFEDGSHVYGCTVLSGMVETLGYEKTQKELDATFIAVQSEIFRALEQHSVNTGTGEYAMNKLRELFFCSVPQFERPNFYTVSEGDGGTDGDDAGVIGGIGSDVVYGSDDQVLDPLTNTYVEYGKILSTYYEIMFAKTEDGNYTDEEKQAMEKYFAILYGGFEKEGE